MSTITPFRTPHIAASPQTSKAPPTAAPDLVVDRMDPTESFPMSGDPLKFNVLVRNQGNAPAGPFQLDLSSDGKRFASVRAQGLAAGAQLALRALGPLHTAYGDQMVWVQADVDTLGQVPESNESNNYLIGTVSLQQPFPPSPWPPGPGGPGGPGGPYPPPGGYPHKG